VLACGGGGHYRSGSGGGVGSYRSGSGGDEGYYWVLAVVVEDITEVVAVVV
jgi:hypothetical protein